MNGKLIMNVNSIRAGYDVKDRYVEAVNDVSLSIIEGEILGIVGESGCGKSTLLRVIYGYIEPPLRILTGKVSLILDQEKTYSIVPIDRKFLEKEIWWRKISWIPQAAQNVLNPVAKISTHFEETIKAHSQENIDKKEMREFVEKHIKIFGLSSEVLNSYPHQLSGGMRQRIVIALATILNPKVLLADEPTSALDVVVQRAILQLFKNLKESMNTTIVLVSHDIQMLSTIADRMAVMYAGEIVEIANTEKLLEEPLHPYTKALIDSTPKLGIRGVIKGLIGQPPDLSSPPPGCRFHPRCPFAMDRCRRESPHVIKIDDRGVKCWIYM